LFLPSRIHIAVHGDEHNSLHNKIMIVTLKQPVNEKYFYELRQYVYFYRKIHWICTSQMHVDMCTSLAARIFWRTWWRGM